MKTLIIQQLTSLNQLEEKNAGKVEALGDYVPKHKIGRKFSNSVMENASLMCVASPDTW